MWRVMADDNGEIWDPPPTANIEESEEKGRREEETKYSLRAYFM